MKGRKPKSPALKLLAGNPGNRPIPDNPPPLAGALAPPPSLTGLALATWNAVVAEMTALGTLGRENTRLLERYCLMYARWREAEAHIAQHGVMVIGSRDLPIPSPMLAIAATTSDRLLKIEIELGYTPQARSRIAAPPPAPAADNPADEFAVA